MAGNLESPTASAANISRLAATSPSDQGLDRIWSGAGLLTFLFFCPVPTHVKATSEFAAIKTHLWQPVLSQWNLCFLSETFYRKLFISLNLHENDAK